MPACDVHRAPSVDLLRGCLELGFRSCPAPGDWVSLNLQISLVFVQEVEQVHFSFSVFSVGCIGGWPCLLLVCGWPSVVSVSLCELVAGLGEPRRLPQQRFVRASASIPFGGGGT